MFLGECGHQPAVRVWDLQSDPQSGQPGLAPQPQQIAEYLGHKYGVNCVVSKLLTLDCDRYRIRGIVPQVFLNVLYKNSNDSYNRGVPQGSVLNSLLFTTVFCMV